MTIRRANILDFPGVFRLIIEFGANEDDSYKVMFTEETAIRAAVEILNHHLAFVVIEDKEVVAGIGGTLQDMIMIPGKMFMELFFYSRVKGKGYGTQLLTAAESYCKEFGIVRMIVGRFGNKEWLDRFYRMKGYKFLETHFVKEI